MAQQGTSADLGFWRGIERIITAKSFTVPACTLNFIQARLRETTTNNLHRVRAAVYDSGGNLLYQSSARQDITTAGATYDFSFSSASLTAGTYYFSVMGNNSSSDVEISNAFDSGDPLTSVDASIGDDTNPSSPVAPVTASFSAGFENFALLIDYTAGGGGGGYIPRRMLMGVG